MRIEQLWRYPVKSMMGEPLDRCAVGELGLAGDRGWAVRDEARGTITGAKKLGGLMRFAAGYVAEPDGPVEIRCPDGSIISSSEPDPDAKLSDALGHDVTLWPRQPATDLEHYRRVLPADGDLLGELRAIFGRDPDEPLPDFTLFPPEIIQYESPPGTYFDAFPLLVMSSAALESVARACPGSVIDVRRFRPNLVVGTDGGDEHPEQAWIGARARIGSAEVEFVGGCPRCVMITREIDETIPVDRAPLRHVVAELDQNLGVYATVVEAGEISVGDPVELVSSP
ncbi:MAG: hypothetical protein JJLCMIEE_01118 [Acidimicrobiales bacterium]|nr:MAG: MOSC domain-containing protein [Actinomycetota bacterium]MBV6508059.1 hypothetical protein [Acidimicrobiales bacterium]RIK05314.1 MAG: Fe-S oxidoreductase [Acidobacteriota bacterium]